MSIYPKISLAIDNCVFYKRWTTPDEWARVIADSDVNYIEASADTELDPLYMGKAYLDDWINEVLRAEERHGVKVCNLYSGHGSYATLGIAHPDKRVRDNLCQNFFFPLVRAAGRLSGGIGFFAHAFKHDILQDATLYARYTEIVTDVLCRINEYAGTVACGKLGIEKMYTPHQYPWRNADLRELLLRVTEMSGRDFYFTEDVGHHHTKFVRPEKAMLVDENLRGLWLGTDKADKLARDFGATAWDEITAEVESNPQLFSEQYGEGCYDTLRELGCYSPIVHLQQTNGAMSAHLPFTEEENKKGIIEGRAVLQAIKESYDRPVESGMPSRCDEIFLTLELFSGTTSIMRDVLADCRASVKYWRRFVSKDGMRLDELLERMEG